jgi:hypothetical protein
VDDHCAWIDLVLRNVNSGAVYNIGGEGQENLAVTQLIVELTGCDAGLVRHVEDRPNVTALSVHLARRRDEHGLLLLARLLEHHLCAVHVGLDRPDRALDDQLNADGGREVVDDVLRIDELRD